jgi:hypothetical protein
LSLEGGGDSQWQEMRSGLGLRSGG